MNWSVWHFWRNPGRTAQRAAQSRAAPERKHPQRLGPLTVAGMFVLRDCEWMRRADAPKPSS